MDTTPWWLVAGFWGTGGSSGSEIAPRRPLMPQTNLPWTIVSKAQSYGPRPASSRAQYDIHRNGLNMPGTRGLIEIRSRDRARRDPAEFWYAHT